MINNGNTNFIGNTTELDVLAYISRLHYYVSIPFGGNARYDQIWDINGKLYKVQIKTSNISDDGSVISFNTGKYDEAIALLSSYPSQVSGYDESQKLLQKI
mgnify:CR=1 FL=1